MNINVNIYIYMHILKVIEKGPAPLPSLSLFSLYICIDMYIYI